MRARRENLASHPPGLRYFSTAAAPPQLSLIFPQHGYNYHKLSIKYLYIFNFTYKCWWDKIIVTVVMFISGGLCIYGIRLRVV